MQRFNTKKDQYQSFLVLGPNEPHTGKGTENQQGIVVCLPGHQRSEEFAQDR